MRAWRWIADEAYLAEVLQHHRARSCEKALSFAVGLLLYNIIELIRAHIAAAQQRSPQTIPTEKLFGDVQRELVAWSVLLSAAATVPALDRPRSAATAADRLHELLDTRWTDRRIKKLSQKCGTGVSPVS